MEFLPVLMLLNVRWHLHIIQGWVIFADVAFVLLGVFPTVAEFSDGFELIKIVIFLT